MLTQWIDAFTNDKTAVLVLLLIPLDLIAGVVAAIVSDTQKFQFTYLSDFLRADVLGKAVPYFLLWVLLHVAGWDFEVPGIPSFDVMEEVAGAAAILALGASLAKSLRDIGLIPEGTNDTLAGPDPTTPG